MLLDPHHLAALAAILRHGSFEAAAADLSVTPSAISQRIKVLEDRVGTALIRRGTPCTGTRAGLRIAQHASDIGLLEAQLSRELALDSDKGPARVRVAVPADCLAVWFIDAMAQVDGLLFDLVIDDQDHSAEWLRRGEVSAAVTVGGQPVTGCDMQALGVMQYVATASPAFMARWFSQGVSPHALAQAPCLIFNRKDRLQNLWIAQQFSRSFTPPAHYLPSSQGFVEAALAGLGWGMNPEPLVRSALAQGRLQELVPNAPLDVPISWQTGRIQARALAPLTKAVVRAAATGLTPGS